MELLHQNDVAPNFCLTGVDEKEYTLEQFRGKRVILYFYPKDDTPGCTKEACTFRDDYKHYTDNNIVIIGVSADNPKSHKRFVEKYDLPFLLLSDPGKEVLKAYGSWGEKKMYGRIYMGLIRKTFLIDEKGKIIKIYPKVRVAGHSDAILKEFGIKK